MKLNEIEFGSARPIEGYGPGFFRIGGEVWPGSLLVWEEGAAAWDGFADHGSLLALSNEIDVVFVGTGTEIAPLPKDFRDTLEKAGFGVEAMNSPSACRTYNVLLSEGRRIAAALLPVD